MSRRRRGRRGVQGLSVAFHYGSFAQIIHSYRSLFTSIRWYKIVRYIVFFSHSFFSYFFLLLVARARPADDNVGIYFNMRRRRRCMLMPHRIYLYQYRHEYRRRRCQSSENDLDDFLDRRYLKS